MIQVNDVETREISEVNGTAEVEPPGFISRSCYRAGYCVAYGVVFPTLLVVSVLPTDNALGHGLCDGASAAKDASRRANQRVCDSSTAVGQKAGNGYAEVARKLQGRVESIQDAIAERNYRRRLAPT